MDPASFQIRGCFSGDELLAYRKGGLPAAKRSRVFHHLNTEKCERCRDLFRLVGEDAGIEQSPGVAQKMIERLKKEGASPRSYPFPFHIEKGQVWTTACRPGNTRDDPIGPVEETFPVLIISKGNGRKTPDNIIRVIPVSFDTEYELAGETLAITEGSPLSYPVLLEVFNERPMPAGNLDEYRGSLSQNDLKLIMETRAQFLEGAIPEPDEDYLAWKEKELKLAEHLSFPVNEGLWGEERHDETIEIPVHEYRKAADVSEGELSDVSPHVLLKEGGIFLGIVQMRDTFLLRLVVEDDTRGPLPKIFFNEKVVSLEQKGPGVYETQFGYADQMPEKMRITLQIGEDHRVFHVRFQERPTWHE